MLNHSGVENPTQEVADHGNQNGADATNNVVIVGKQQEAVGDGNGVGRMKMKTSKVWSDFSIITRKDGSKKIQCKHCNTKLAFQNTGATSHFG